MLNQLDCLVVPSSPFDATPRVVLEAFSAGVPVVSFAAGGIPEIVKDGETGFLVNVRSPKALAARISDVLNADSESVARVIANARIAWQDKFSLNRYREEISERILRTLQIASLQSGVQLPT